MLMNDSMQRNLRVAGAHAPPLVHPNFYPGVRSVLLQGISAERDEESAFNLSVLQAEFDQSARAGHLTDASEDFEFRD